MLLKTFPHLWILFFVAPEILAIYGIGISFFGKYHHNAIYSKSNIA